ncbi:hypothetical protein, partial [Kitasatospora sp. SC0581]|uniref:hypothetical protein n=1 Tax=Kitasatospora sp. SC0581 TaxID=3394360 RepID=UPI003A86C691
MGVTQSFPAASRFAAASRISEDAADSDGDLTRSDEAEPPTAAPDFSDAPAGSSPLGVTQSFPAASRFAAASR